MNRICIYPKDVQTIRQIKKLNHKQKHQPITVDEFCQFMGLNPKRVMKNLR
jgi:DNA polymerase/3'-5' exonuclease PolX